MQTKLTRIITIFTIFLNVQQLSGHTSDKTLAMLFNAPIGIQQGYGFNHPHFRTAFDINVTLLVLNAGYNYNSFYKSNAYIGLGVGSLIQLQYGYGFYQKNHMVRIRTDFPLFAITKEKSILDYISVGAYYNYAFKSKRQKSSVGISLCLELGSIFVVSKKNE